MIIHLSTVMAGHVWATVVWYAASNCYYKSLFKSTGKCLWL